MSMNQYMHPRNIYKQPPDFKKLALQFPEFRRHISTDLTGKVTFDFKNVEALRSLTCTLLKKDFNLDVELPLDKLIPTVPLRLNYVLWIEDLVSLIQPLQSEIIKGIDIGTGASCIYPLLMSKKNQWHVIATEIDTESFKFACDNVSRNNLDDYVKIVKVTENSSLLVDVLKSYPDEYDFCVCNPPFFSSKQDLNPFNRKLDRPRPKNAFCASTDEVVYKGGEIEYITRIINESKELNTQIKIYTTMIGHKKNLPQLKKLLKEIDDVVSFKQTEFCQGNTTRWGLAWTYLDIDLRKIPESFLRDKHSLGKPIVYKISKSDLTPYKISVMYDKLIEILKSLQIDYTEVKHINKLIELVIVAFSNTWSHQRRKRREKLRLNSTDHEPINNNQVPGSPSGVTETCEKLSELDLPSDGGKKRVLEDDRGYYNCKKMKTTNVVLQDSASEIYLKASIVLIKDNCSDIVLELNFIEGSGTKDALHQVFLYIKNNLKTK